MRERVRSLGALRRTAASPAAAGAHFGPPRAAFSCYVRSDAPEKGTDCAQLFLTMQARRRGGAGAAPQPHAAAAPQACMSAHASEFAAFGAELAANEAEHAAQQKAGAPPAVG